MHWSSSRVERQKDKKTISETANQRETASTHFVNKRGHTLKRFQFASYRLDTSLAAHIHHKLRLPIMTNPDHQQKYSRRDNNADNLEQYLGLSCTVFVRIPGTELEQNCYSVSRIFISFLSTQVFTTLLLFLFPQNLRRLLDPEHSMT